MATMYKLRLLKGGHAEGPKTPRGGYNPGDVFESPVNRAAVEPARFALVGGEGSPVQEDSVLERKLREARAEVEALKAQLASANTPANTPDVDSMTDAELRKFASSFDPPIDLSSASNTEERLSIIKSELDLQ